MEEDRKKDCQPKKHKWPDFQKGVKMIEVKQMGTPPGQDELHAKKKGQKNFPFQDEKGDACQSAKGEESIESGTRAAEKGGGLIDKAST